MLRHKTFTAQTVGLTGKDSLARREQVRQKVEEFINNEITAEKVVSVTESAMSLGGQLAVTVWYRID